MPTLTTPAPLVVTPLARSGHHPPRRRSLFSGTRPLYGLLCAAVLMTLASLAMLPVRSQISITTSALVFIIPVVVSVAVGGFTAGCVATAVGFLTYDYFFTVPYETLAVESPQEWVALAVWALVMVIVARLVHHLNVARTDAQEHAVLLQRLFDVSELLVRETLIDDIGETIVTSARDAFELEGVALLLPRDDSLQLVASAGTPLSPAELRYLSSNTGTDGSGGDPPPSNVRTLPLTVSGRPVGLLALRRFEGTRRDYDMLLTFANQLALALERSRLRDEELRALMLAQVDLLRRSLVGAVSHDLRSPLATITVSTSTLLDPTAHVSRADSRELIGLIDAQAHRLDWLVANLLDMTRLQSGALDLRREVVPLATLVDEALHVVGPVPQPTRIERNIPSDLPRVDVDPVLIRQVLANLIDNAVTHTPDGTTVTIAAQLRPHGKVEVSVTDEGTGIPEDQRATIFAMFNSREAGGRGGLGLAIVHAFISAHHESIWISDSDQGGTVVSFTLPMGSKTEVRV